MSEALTKKVWADPGTAKQRIEELESKVEALTLRINEAMEVYAGMEGFNPETAPEAYCLRIIEQMYKALLEQK